MKNIPKKPSAFWLKYITDNLYYLDGNVFSKKSKYKKPLGTNNKYKTTILEVGNKKERCLISLKIHHIVWFLNTGVWADSEVDHIDRDRYNNLFSNLRLSNPKAQAENRNNFSKKPFNLRYIMNDKKRGVFRVRIKGKYFGVFKNIQEAIAHRDLIIKSLINE